MAEEDPFPGTRAQPVHVRDDHNIAGVRLVHGAAGVRVQKNHVGTAETAVVPGIVMNARRRDAFTARLRPLPAINVAPRRFV